MGELIFNGGMLAFFLGMTAYCGTIEIWEGYVGARYWPMFLLVIADILFVAKTIEVYKKLPKEAKKVDLSVFKATSTHRLLLAFAVTIGYTVIMEPLGFFLSSILYGIAISAILGMRNPIKLVLIGLGLSLLIYAIFVWALDIMVPRGADSLYYFGLWLETLL